MFILRLVITALLILAFIGLGMEAISLLRTDHWQPITAGGLWTNLHAASLGDARAFVQRDIDPDVWSGIAWVLRRPAWLVTGVPGVILLCLDLALGRDGQGSPGRRRFRAG
jgi:hypothetical protein